jgi:protein AroM
MKARTTVGLVTIGQTPRPDLTQDFTRLWQAAFDIVEEGALNGLDDAAIARLAPQAGESDLITRLADGRSIYVSHHRLTPYVQAAIDRVCRIGVDVVIVACTGGFEGLTATRPIVQPFTVLEHAVAAILEPGKSVVVVVPTRGQVDEAKERWTARGYRAEAVLVASPFDGQGDLRGRLNGLASHSDGVIFDCFGFGSDLVAHSSRGDGKPVFVARVLIAKLLSGIFPNPGLAASL